MNGRTLFGIFGVGWLALWLGLSQTGGCSSGQHYQLPSSVRQSPGGYRSFHFWHSGYHGGK